MPDIVARVVVLAVMGAVSVSVWTLRVALTAEGRKAAAALTAGVEAVVFALVFASVLSSLDSPVEVGGYAVGVAAGTFLGLLVDGKLSTGQSAVRVLVDGDGHDLAVALRALGWPVTLLPGEGLRGAAGMLFVVVDVGLVRELRSDLARLAPQAFWVVERLQTAHPSPLPQGYRQVHAAHGAGRRAARPYDAGGAAGIGTATSGGKRGDDAAAGVRGCARRAGRAGARLPALAPGAARVAGGVPR